MNAHEDPRQSWSDADLALCVAYVDGELDLDAQLAFEARLAAEPALAARVRSLLDTDELLIAERAARARARPQRRLRTLAWVAACAATALVTWALFEWRPRPPSTAFEVAVAPSFESAREYVAAHPQLADLRTPGLEALRGGNEAPNVAPAEFLERAREVERSEARARLEADAPAPLEAPFFVVPLRLSGESEVLVVALVAGSEPVRLHPPADAPLAARLPAGEHLLPGPRFEGVGAGDAARVRYSRGYLVPVGSGELSVVIAVRPAGGASLAPGEAERAARDVPSLVEALHEQGFATRTWVVREPR